MLQRKGLDDRCAMAATGNLQETMVLPNVQNGCPVPEPCPGGQAKGPSSPLTEPCPMADFFRGSGSSDGEKPPYLPQPEDTLPAKSDNEMGPTGPWATGRTVFTPRGGFTGLRPICDRYSITQFSTGEWRAHNETFFKQSNRMIHDAQLAAYNGKNSIQKVFKEADNDQQVNKERLMTRAGDVFRWKNELERALTMMTDEIDLLEVEYRRVKASLSVLTIPESIAGEFLQLRSTRLEPDLVRDDVDDELIKELGLCTQIRELLGRTKEQIERQAMELKSAKTRMEFDWTDKKDAYEIDTQCIGLSNDSPLIMWKAGAARVPAEQSTPAGYDHMTREALAQAEATRQRSSTLRSTLDAIYVNSVRDLRTQADRVDAVLGKKVTMTQQCCERLEKELLRCLYEISNIEETIKNLRDSTRNLDNTLKVAQSRLDNRLLRRNVESCRDVPQFGLIEEVKTLGENVSMMMGQIRRAEEAQKGLVKSRGDLEPSSNNSSISHDESKPKMSGPVNRCGAQVVQPHTVRPLMVEAEKPKSSPRRNEANHNHEDNYIKVSNSMGKRGCPKIEPCPGNTANLTVEGATEKGDGDKAALEGVAKMPPGPLGPVPVSHGEDVPMDYWTPLGNLTGTRPAVENFSLSRFSPSELREHNEKVSRECREGIHVAAVAGYNAQCSISRAYAEADRNQMDNNLRLNMRAGIIHRWKRELERTVSDIAEEIDVLQEVRRRTMRAKSVLKLIMNIVKDMSRVRCFRMETDIVRDRVAEEMIKESSLCEEINDLYVRLLDQIKMQIDELKAAKQRVESDWCGKIEAYEIDSGCRGLSSESDTILWKPGSVRIPPDQSSSSGYEHSTKQVISEGQTATERSCTLRANVNWIIEKAVRDLRDQADRLELALTEQIQMQEQAVRRLEAELYKDLHQLSDTEALIDEMQNASRRLDGPMKCAQTRLDNRLLRPGVESCRDVPQFGLIQEVKSLSENVSAALGQIKRAEDSTVALIQTRRNIEKELVIKRKSLYVDRERCQLLRTFYPSAQALGGN